MKRLVTSIALIIASSAAFANGYCDSRPTEAAKRACYRSTYSTVDYDSLAQKAAANMHTNIKAIKDSPLIPQGEKDQFLAGVYQSQKNIDAGCKDNKCVTNSVAQLNNRMVAFYNRFHNK